MRQLQSVTRKPRFSSLITFASIGLLSSAPPAFASDTQHDFNPDILQSVSELYGITEEQAIDRLARETEAALALHALQLEGIDDYAGSWFDAETGKLVIAVSSEAALESIDDDKVATVLVAHDLKSMQTQLNLAISALSKLTNEGSAVGYYFDVQRNEVVLTVKNESAAAISATLGTERLDDNVRLEVVDTLPVLSTGLLRAATGTRNLTWASQHGGTWPCSVGASVEDGYITAGHCGSAVGTGNEFSDSSGSPLGTMVESPWFVTNPSIDSGYVQTVAGWTPSGTVQGYSDGIFPVASAWGGLVQYGVGTTVCRYGQTSGGPHCGTIDAFDITQLFQGGHTVTGLTRVSGGCSDDGDSGGPHVAGAGYIQGTNTGAWKFNASDTCPTQAKYVYFQPITDALDAFSDHDLIMLTGHGSNAPSLDNVECPVAGLGGPGLFSCNTGVVDSQGKPSVQWSGSSGIKPGPVLTETCTVGQTVFVTAQATNTYGTMTKHYSFPCPSF